jgi:phosphomevalonate kinase
MSTENPRLILLFSGKRKSGKDYVCQKIDDHFRDPKYGELKLSFLTLSAPLKEMYATAHNLDYEKLLDSSDYKEKYRLDMIK